MIAALVSQEVVLDIVFGAALVIAGIDIIAAAVKKALPSAISAFVAAASTYGAFYL